MNAFANSLLRSLLSGVSSIRRRTWVLFAASLLLLIVLLIWATITAAGWLFGMAREGVGAAPETLRSATARIEQIIPGAQETVRSASAQAEQIIPGVQGTLGALLPALAAEPPSRDVSGTDPGPVARFPGLARIEWQRAEQQTHAPPRQV